METDTSRRWWFQAWRLAAAAVVGIPFWLAVATVLPEGCAADTCSWFVTGDPLVALACLTALLWRHRFPFTVAMAVTLASTASSLAAGAALLALCSLATRRRPLETGAVAVVHVVAAQVAVGLYPAEDLPSVFLVQLAIPMLTAGTAVAVGTAVGARRAEVRSWRERARSAEREQVALAERARAMERTQIAREMHDVLAHRISLVAMQAGVLDHRGDLSAQDSRTLIRGIADGSQRALEELRDVLGVLRADPGRPEPPQPSLDGLPALVGDARASGLDVTFTTTVTATPPDVVARTCYRIVQEGLTNAARHAPGATVTVTVEGAPGDGLRVTVRNTEATTTVTRPPTSGFGLLGLAERVAHAGGEIDHHPTPGHGYVLTAHLPWPDRRGKRA